MKTPTIEIIDRVCRSIWLVIWAVALFVALMAVLSWVDQKQAQGASQYKYLATALLVLKRPTPAPTPTPSPVGKCENCNGTGKLGDGTIFLPCPVCGGDGIVSNAPAATKYLPAASAAMPAQATRSLPVVWAKQQPAYSPRTYQPIIRRGLLGRFRR